MSYERCLVAGSVRSAGARVTGVAYVTTATHARVLRAADGSLRQRAPVCYTQPRLRQPAPRAWVLLYLGR